MEKLEVSQSLYEERNQGRKLGLLIALGILGLTVGTTASALPDPLTSLNRHGDLSFGAEHMGYREANSSGTGDIDSDGGDPLAGRITLGWQGDIAGIQDLRAEFGFHWVDGGINYSGYAQNPRTGLIVPIESTANEVVTTYQLRIGKGFRLTGNDLLTPYVQYGLTDWSRDVGSFSEDFSHKFWTGGLEYQYAINRQWVVDADAAVGQTQDPQVWVSTTSTNYSLGTKPYMDYRLGFRYSPTRYGYAGIDGYWTTYQYGESDAINGLVYPSSKTTHAGAQAVLGFTY